MMTDNPHDLQASAAAASNDDAGESASQPEQAGDGRATAADQVATERDRYYDLLLRKTAEFENYRKRIDRERRDWTEGTVADVLADLLPVIDDLERALKADVAGDRADAYRTGVELIHRRLLDLLRRRGVTPVEAVGRVFDPHVHQAVTYEPTEGKPDGEITEEYARGYVLGERLLRPAMVKVAKA